MDPNELTPLQEKTLKQVGFGVTLIGSTLFDELLEPVDCRSVASLVKRGLLFYKTLARWGVLARIPYLTSEGVEVFEGLRGGGK